MKNSQKLLVTRNIRAENIEILSKYICERKKFKGKLNVTTQERNEEIVL